jgi:hypothetical protein
MKWRRRRGKENELPLESIERPRELTGTTWRVRFDEHWLYVTVNDDGQRVLEVFVRVAIISAGVGLLASQMLGGGSRSRAWRGAGLKSQERVACRL